MKTFQDLTTNEREFLTALVGSDFFSDTVHDDRDAENLMTGTCWSDCIPGFSDEAKHGGVAGSLVKKGLLDSNASGYGEFFSLTKKGARLYATR